MASCLPWAGGSSSPSPPHASHYGQGDLGQPWKRATSLHPRQRRLSCSGSSQRPEWPGSGHRSAHTKTD